MANKITLDTITSSFASTSLFNTNFAAIKSELDDKVLYRNNPTGEANQMENAIDMNSNDILNARLIDADAFSIDGTLLTTETSLETLTYLDTEFTNVAGETTFTASYTPSFCDVFYNGVLLAASDVTTTSGTEVVLASAVVDASDVITIRSYSAFSAGDGITQSDADARYLEVNSNLSDLENVETARTNLGVDGAVDRAGNFGKNLIINGDFSIWQRGTSQTSNGYGSDDRWRNGNNGTTKTHSQQSFTLGQTDVPGNPKYYSRTVVTSVAGASNYALKEHRLESVTKFAGKEVTLSFWAKADAAKDISTEYVQTFATGGSPSATITSISPTTHSLTTSWQKFSTTVTLPSVAGKTLGTDSDDSTRLIFWFEAGSDFDSRTNSLGQQSGTFDIANVQLEFGDTATEFEYVSPADQLTRCKRYFERITGNATDQTTLGVGFALASATAVSTPFYYAEKRAIPAITLNGTLSAFDSSASAVTLDAGVSYQDIAEKAARVVAARSTGTHTSGDVFLTRITNSSSDSIDVDAEL